MSTDLRSPAGSNPFLRTFLLGGMPCMIIAHGEHFGKYVTLVKREPTVINDKATETWITSPLLYKVLESGISVVHLWTRGSLMPLYEPRIHSQLVLERREDCKADPRIASYILGRDLS